MPEPSLLRTHPPTAERVERLLSLYAEAEPVILPTPLPDPRRIGSELPLGLEPGRPRFHATGYWY
jgi:heat shock protein HtpX